MKIHIPGLSTREHQYSELSKTSEDEDVGAVSPKQNANKFHTAAIVLLILGPTILSIVLAILLIRTKSSNPPTRGWSHSESKIDGFLESMQTLDVQFGADTRYMSLSHEYDELWKEDLRAANARIFHPTLRSEVGSGVGVIAMYVSRFSDRRLTDQTVEQDTSASLSGLVPQGIAGCVRRQSHWYRQP